MSVINSIPLIAAGDDGYQISRSVRLRSSASAYLNRTQGTPTDEKKFTQSAWLKRGKLGVYQAVIGGRDNSTGQTPLYFTSGDQIGWGESDGVSTYYSATTTAVFRDPSAWYHIVTVYDSNNATAADRLIIYVNGVRQAITISGSGSSIPSGRAGYWNQSGTSILLGATNTATDFFDGYLTEINNIDGQALTPSSFGETDAVTGVWKPKKYAGTYGTNGFYLNFSDNSAATAAAIGKDYSGNGNNWTPNNISVTAGATYDSMIDVPTPYADGGNGRGNYAVLNPLNAGMASTITQGNLTFQGISNANQGYALSTIGVESGSFYFEVQPSSFTGVLEVYISNVSTVTAGYRSDGSKDIDGANSSYGASWTSSNTIGCAYNAGTKSVTFYKDNTSQGTFTYTGSGPVYAGVVVRGTASANGYVNFGQRPFAYTPPTGFKALNTQNLPDSTIKKGNQYFDISTWTGAGQTGTASITGLNFAPDLVWVKSRSVYANSHLLYDTVRGASTSGASKALSSNAISAEGSINDNSTYGYLSAFNSDGFSYVGGSSPAYFSGSGAAYVAWQWKESASAGFDIVTYTGNGTARSINHSLGVTPSMMIIKGRGNAYDWRVWHKSFATGYDIQLNATSAASSAPTVYASAPSSTVFNLGTGSAVNENAINFVAYLFAEVAGFSKFGSYTGNGSADGPFVYCGFRPRWVMIKRTDAAGYGWEMIDSSRDPYNVTSNWLYANSSNTESSGSAQYIDFLSNGFKIRTTDAYSNASGGTYIFAAFAESPFKAALAR